MSNHGTQEVACADELGVRGGGRMVARCRCGWRSRSALTRRFAQADLDAHLRDAAR
jgi:hypothetical protein